MIELLNACVFDGMTLRDGRYDIRIEGNAIAGIVPHRPSAPVSDSGIDLDGRTVLPGLIHGHMHADLFKLTAADFMSGMTLGRERPPGVLMAIALRTCGVMLDSGFTGFVGAACSSYTDPQLKMAIEEGIVDGPRIRPCSHHVGTTGDNNAPRRWWDISSEPGTDVFADGPDAMRKLVREEIRAGARIIKIYSSAGHGIESRVGMRNMARDEIAAVVDAAHGRGVLVRSHVCTKELIMEALDLGIDVIDHGDEIDEECIERMAKAGTFWVPSLRYVDAAAASWAANDPDVHRACQQYRRMLPIAHRAGIPILLGDDYGGDPQFGHFVGCYAGEIPMYAGIDGLSVADVLSWGTVNGGKLLVDAPARVGIVEEGALADLIVVEGDLLGDATLLQRPGETLKLVVTDGRIVRNRLPTG